MSKQQEVTVDVDGGETATATKEAPSEPWEIFYPWGGDRFYGTVTEVRARMQAEIARLVARCGRCSDTKPLVPNHGLCEDCLSTVKHDAEREKRAP